MDFNDDYFDENEYEECKDFLKFAVDVYESYLESVSEDDFVINPFQMYKFINIVNFLSKIAKENNYEIEPLLFSKKDCNAEITIRSTVFCLIMNEVSEFCNLVKEACNITFEGNLDGEVLLTILVKDVFKQKD